jgi:hypothetical protein
MAGDLLGRNRAAALGVMAAFGWWAAGCSGSCTDVGCVDGFTVTVNVETDAVAAGMHTLAVTVDGTEMTCTFAIPRPDVGSTGITSVPCSGGLIVEVYPAMTCPTTQTGTGSENICQPIAGVLTETIELPGMPRTVRVQQMVDGDVLLDQTLTPAYKAYAPNGTSCGPTCHEATAELTIP